MSSSWKPRVGDKRRYLAKAVQLSLLLVPVVIAGYFISRRVWASYHRRAAEQLLEKREFHHAQAHLRECLKVWSRNPELHVLAARTARRAGLFEEAEQLLNACEELHVPTEVVVLERTLLYAQRGAVDTAVENKLWALIKQDHPATPLILEALAQGYIYDYRLDNALRCLERWLELQPDTVPALIWRAQVLHGLQQYEAALKDLRRAIELDPDLDDARTQLADLLLSSEALEEAEPHLEILRQRQPMNPAVVIGLATCQYHRGNLAEAERLLDVLLAARPDCSQALRERGRIALDTKGAEEAEDWLRRCLTIDPADRGAIYLFSRCLQLQGRQTEARDWIAKLERLDADLARLKELAQLVVKTPWEIGLRYEAGVICLRYGKEPEGLRWLTGVLQMDPFHRPTNQLLAEHYEHSGKPDLAKLHRQRVEEPTR
jgi:tetratricopeptide (TPR) repeat protein